MAGVLVHGTEIKDSECVSEWTTARDRTRVLLLWTFYVSADRIGTATRKKPCLLSWT